MLDPTSAPDKYFYVHLSGASPNALVVNEWAIGYWYGTTTTGTTTTGTTTPGSAADGPLALAVNDLAIAKPASQSLKRRSCELRIRRTKRPVGSLPPSKPPTSPAPPRRSVSHLGDVPQFYRRPASQDRDTRGLAMTKLIALLWSLLRRLLHDLSVLLVFGVVITGVVAGSSLRLAKGHGQRRNTNSMTVLGDRSIAISARWRTFGCRNHSSGWRNESLGLFRKQRHQQLRKILNAQDSRGVFYAFTVQIRPANGRVGNLPFPSIPGSASRRICKSCSISWPQRPAILRSTARQTIPRRRSRCAGGDLQARTIDCIKTSSRSRDYRAAFTVTDSVFWPPQQNLTRSGDGPLFSRHAFHP